MLGSCLRQVREKSPLVHNITNYVTVNDVANVILALGASPIMADDEMEVEEITSICQVLNINIGTLNHHSIQSMLLAGKKANELLHPVVLDPVGAGASTFRTKTAMDLINQVKFDVIRGNISEIKTLALGNGVTQGVDANLVDAVTKENLEISIEFAKKFAKDYQCIVAITGSIDLVSDGSVCYVIYNGKPQMSRITGTGCQLSGMLAGFLAANKTCLLEAAVAAVCTMGVAGEIAWENMKDGDGNATYRNRIIDAIYNMTEQDLERRARYEMR